MLSSGHSGGYKRGFCVISQKPEVVGGKCFGVFYSITWDLSNGTSIIAIGHHSRKLGRQVCPSFFFVCDANFSNFAAGYRPEFSTYQAVIAHQQSPRSNLIPFLKILGL